MNESGVSVEVDGDEPDDVLVSLLLPLSFDELPHAESAKATTATVAIAAARPWLVSIGPELRNFHVGLLS